MKKSSKTAAAAAFALFSCFSSVECMKMTETLKTGKNTVVVPLSNFIPWLYVLKDVTETAFLELPARYSHLRDVLHSSGCPSETLTSVIKPLIQIALADERLNITDHVDGPRFPLHNYLASLRASCEHVNKLASVDPKSMLLPLVVSFSLIEQSTDCFGRLVEKIAALKKQYEAAAEHEAKLKEDMENAKKAAADTFKREKNSLADEIAELKKRLETQKLSNLELLKQERNKLEREKQEMERKLKEDFEREKQEIMRQLEEQQKKNEQPGNRVRDIIGQLYDPEVD
ncbi:hypothetical protein FACS189449_12470 [Alphaproteobacteria bacterium]|nr:hypothetical protein FACS189449_12470 [Alphaproteobacteria bacterium]